jgi:ribosomal protein L7/L12
MQDPTSLINKCQSLHAEGKNKEDIVSFLRAQGCSKVESIAIFAKALGIGLAEAKNVVHLSDAWSDTREGDERFQNSLREGDGK